MDGQLVGVCAKNVPRARNSGAGRWSSSASAPWKPAAGRLPPVIVGVSKTWSSGEPHWYLPAGPDARLRPRETCPDHALPHPGCRYCVKRPPVRPQIHADLPGFQLSINQLGWPPSAGPCASLALHAAQPAPPPASGCGKDQPP